MIRISSRTMHVYCEIVFMVIFYAILDNFTPFFHFGKHSFSGMCHIYLIGNTQVLDRHWHIGWCLLVFMVIYDVHDFMCCTCPKTLNLLNVVEKKAYPLLLDCDLWGSFVIARVYHWKKMKFVMNIFIWFEVFWLTNC